MKHPTGEEIWSPGDWWRRKTNKRKMSKHLGRHGHYLPATNQSDKQQAPQIIHRVQVIPNISADKWIAGSWLLGILITKIVYGSWFFALTWPVCLFFQILMKLI